MHFSIRQLNRVLRQLGLRRHSTASRLDQARAAILTEIHGSGQNLGYRGMARRMASTHGIFVSRETVRSILLSVDPDSVELRRKRVIARRSYINKGPNFLIHIDGYDKLKRFGFPIHAAIDGFSRMLLWLEAVTSNNNPRIKATLFLHYIREIEGVPRCVRMDAGTENTLTEDIQKAFRHEHTDDMAGAKSVIKGCSHSNQRIERWWRSGRQSGFQYWIELFANMETEGYLSTSNPLHIECMRFCFWELLQTDLTKIKADWNNHHIRQSRGADSIGGKPEMMFHMPQLFGAHDYKTLIDNQDLEEVYSRYGVMSWQGCNDEIQTLLSQRQLRRPSTVAEADILFRQLTEMFGQ